MTGQIREEREKEREETFKAEKKLDQDHTGIIREVLKGGGKNIPFVKFVVGS